MLAGHETGYFRAMQSVVNIKMIYFWGLKSYLIMVFNIEMEITSQINGKWIFMDVMLCSVNLKLPFKELALKDNG